MLKNVEDKKKVPDVEKSLHELWLLTKDLTSSEESTQLIDDLSVFLLRLFMRQNHVLNKHIAQIKSFFGDVTSKQTNKIHQLVTIVSVNLGNEAIENLQKLISEDSDETTDKNLFGKSIKLVPSADYFQDTSFLQDLGPAQSISSNTVIDAFSMKYEHKAEPEVSAKKYDRAWLTKSVSTDVLEPLIVTLKSQRSNDELQNELFELMGFDKFEIIQEILENRKSIIKYLDTVEKKELVKDHIIKKQKEDVTAPAPNYLMPVLVQSEKEKELSKLARKDEKKIKSIKTVT